MKKKKHIWYIPVAEGLIRAFLVWIVMDYLCSTLPKGDMLLTIVCGGGIILSSFLSLYTCIFRGVKLRYAIPLCLLSEIIGFVLMLMVLPGVFPPAAELTEEIANQITYFIVALLVGSIFSRLMVGMILFIRNLRAKKAPVHKKSSFSYKASGNLRNLDPDNHKK